MPGLGRRPRRRPARPRRAQRRGHRRRVRRRRRRRRRDRPGARRPRRDPRAPAGRLGALRPRAAGGRRRRARRPARPPGPAAGGRARHPADGGARRGRRGDRRRARRRGGARPHRAAPGDARAGPPGAAAVVPRLREPPRRPDAVALRDRRRRGPARRPAPLRPRRPRPAADPAEAVRRFLRWYGPATAGDVADWAGLARPHARRLWDAVAGELADAPGGRSLLAADQAALADPPAARGVRLLPPGDPLLQKANRTALVPDEAVRRRLFRPVASPGAVLRDGRLAGLWRARARGRALELTVEPIGRLRRDDLEAEARRVAALRGAADLRLAIA
ncbi:MAG: winged helix DNA-binding domain-containing protein [Solirubrobacteraceae bacterium]|nr:winged helix DNA-binding domain-containing protein [Solirubrobacteraceae bacterium]